MYCFRPGRSARRGFTLLEVATAVLILGMICSSVLVVMGRALSATIDLRKRMQAFEIARENMETLLGQPTASDLAEFGVHPLYPDVEWETTVEPFYEPITNKMWIQAVCTASYMDSREEKQTITLTHWLTGLSERQIKQILDQQDRQQEYLDLLNANDQTVQEQLAIREYLRQKGLNVKGYDQILTEQKRQKRNWINEYEYDPDLFDELVGQLRQAEYQWLDSSGFNRDDFDQWGQAQSAEFWAAIAQRAGSSAAISGSPGSDSSHLDGLPLDDSTDTMQGNEDDRQTKPSDSGRDRGEDTSNTQDKSPSKEPEAFERPTDFNRWNPEQQKLWEDLMKRLNQ